MLLNGLDFPTGVPGLRRCLRRCLVVIGFEGPIQIGAALCAALRAAGRAEGKSRLELRRELADLLLLRLEPCLDRGSSGALKARCCVWGIVVVLMLIRLMG